MSKLDSKVDSPEKISSLVGDKIKELRVSKNLTQDELAAKCGLSRTAIYNLEIGKSNLDSLIKVLMGLDKMPELLNILKPVIPPTIQKIEKQQTYIGRQRVRK